MDNPKMINYFSEHWYQLDKEMTRFQKERPKDPQEEIPEDIIKVIL